MCAEPMSHAHAPRAIHRPPSAWPGGGAAWASRKCRATGELEHADCPPPATPCHASLALLALFLLCTCDNLRIPAGPPSLAAGVGAGEAFLYHRQIRRPTLHKLADLSAPATESPHVRGASGSHSPARWRVNLSGAASACVAFDGVEVADFRATKPDSLNWNFEARN